MSKKSRKKRTITVLGAAVIAMACFGCCVLALVAGNAAPSSGTIGLGVDVCAGVVTTPRLQVGIAWYSPLASYRGPLAFSPTAACIHVPVSSMPTRLYREWMLPP